MSTYEHMSWAWNCFILCLYLVWFLRVLHLYVRLLSLVWTHRKSYNFVSCRRILDVSEMNMDGKLAALLQHELSVLTHDVVNGRIADDLDLYVFSWAYSFIEFKYFYCYRGIIVIVITLMHSMSPYTHHC